MLLLFPQLVIIMASCNTLSVLEQIVPQQRQYQRSFFVRNILQAASDPVLDAAELEQSSPQEKHSCVY